MLLLLVQQGAHARWDESAPAWLELLGRWGPWALLTLIAVLLVRAALQHGRFRARGVLGDEAQRAVQAAVIEAEKRTIGEIVPVVLERSDRHPGACWVSALVALVLGTVLLEGLLPWHDPLLVVLCQVGIGAVGYAAAALLPAWKRLFVSEKRATEMALEQASQEFFAQGLHRTAAQTGVLIFVSLLEKRVVVLGDAGIDARVGAGHWKAVDEAILDGARRGALREGLIEGIARCADVLAEHFPWQEGDRNEIPDRMVVRRE
jgi:putative membrane protein